MTVLDQPVDDGTVGIEPVPASLRRLRAVDIGVLWGDLSIGVLSIGVLVLAAGAAGSEAVIGTARSKELTLAGASEDSVCVNSGGSEAGCLSASIERLGRQVDQYRCPADKHRIRVEALAPVVVEAAVVAAVKAGADRRARATYPEPARLAFAERFTYEIEGVSGAPPTRQVGDRPWSRFGAVRRHIRGPFLQCSGRCR